MALPGFLFGGSTNLSYQDLQDRRAAADALAKRLMGQQPKNTAEGIGAVLTGIGAGLGRRSANAGMREGQEKASSQLNDLFSKITGQTGAVPSILPETSAATLPMAGAGRELAASNPSPASVPSFADDGTELGGYLSDPTRRSTLPAGMRNNNPGNIKYVGQKVPGIVGPSVNTDQGDPQAVFDSPESGMRAMHTLLGKKYAGGKLTPNQMIAGNMGWTPGNFDAARNVAKTMGISPDDDIGFNDPNRAAQFMQALILQEHGQKGRLYPQALISSAIGGGRPVEVANANPRSAMTAAAAIEQQANGSGNIAPSVGTPNDQPPMAGNQPAPFDAGRFGDPIKLSEMPAAMDDAGQRLSTQANSYAANPQMPMGGLQPLPSREVGPAPQVAAAPQQPQPSQQVAQAGPMPPPQMPQAQPFQMDPRVLQLLSNPFLDEGQRSAVQLYAQQQMRAQQQAQEEQTWRARQEYSTQQRQSDPAYKLGLQQTQAEIERMNKPGYRMLTNDERKAYGIPDYDTRPYQMSREGQVSAVGGMGQGQSAGVEANQREALAARYGIDPKSAEGQRFILTGTLPTSDRGVTAGDREAIRDADDQAQAARSAIDQLQSILTPGAENSPSLNDRAGSGALADWQSWAARNDPTGFFDDRKGEATTELSNTVLGQALGSLKSIFGAAPTEGERQILLDMQASVDKTPAERKIIIDKAVALANRRLQFNQDRAGDLRGGSYYKPDRGAAPNVQTNPPRTPAEAAGMPPAPGNSAGPQPGMIEDGYRFRGGDPGNPANWEKVN